MRPESKYYMPLLPGSKHVKDKGPFNLPCPPPFSRAREEPATEHLLSYAHRAATRGTGGHREREFRKYGACVALRGLSNERLWPIWRTTWQPWW